MRTLITALVIFFALCVTMVANFRYINETADELTELTEALAIDDPSCLEKIDEIEKLWNKSWST